MLSTKLLDIRISAVRRLTREMKFRRIDVESEKQRKEGLITAGEDEWTVGKQQEVIAEAERMIPDAKQRLEDGLNDLKALMEAMDSEITSEDKSKAETVIQEGEATLRG